MAWLTAPALAVTRSSETEGTTTTDSPGSLRRIDLQTAGSRACSRSYAALRSSSFSSPSGREASSVASRCRPRGVEAEDVEDLDRAGDPAQLHRPERARDRDLGGPGHDPLGGEDLAGLRPGPRAGR